MSKTGREGEEGDGEDGRRNLKERYRVLFLNNRNSRRIDTQKIVHSLEGEARKKRARLQQLVFQESKFWGFGLSQDHLQYLQKSEIIDLNIDDA